MTSSAASSSTPIVSEVAVIIQFDLKHRADAAVIHSCCNVVLLFFKFMESLLERLAFAGSRGRHVPQAASPLRGVSGCMLDVLTPP